MRRKYEEGSLLEKIRVERQQQRREIAPWVEGETLRAIEDTYESYNKGGMRREPCLTATYIAEVMPAYAPSAFWRHGDRRDHISAVQAALGRLKRKGMIGSSLGVGFSGKETHCWEPRKR